MNPRWLVVVKIKILKENQFMQMDLKITTLFTFFISKQLIAANI